MSKNHRGKGIIDKYKRGRGTCPVCQRTGVKIIHEREQDKKKIFVCKVCNVVMSRREIQLKKKLETVTETETKKTAVETTGTKTEEKGEKKAPSTEKTPEQTTESPDKTAEDE